MPITTSWHSARLGTEVYHNNTGCTEENNIEPYNVREGDGGLRLCKHCERLNKESRISMMDMGGLLGGFRSAQSRSILDFMKEGAKK